MYVSSFYTEKKTGRFILKFEDLLLLLNCISLYEISRQSYFLWKKNNKTNCKFCLVLFLVHFF